MPNILSRQCMFPSPLETYHLHFCLCPVTFTFVFAFVNETFVFALSERCSCVIKYIWCHLNYFSCYCDWCIFFKRISGLDKLFHETFSLSFYGRFRCAVRSRADWFGNPGLSFSHPLCRNAIYQWAFDFDWAMDLEAWVITECWNNNGGAETEALNMDNVNFADS